MGEFQQIANVLSSGGLVTILLFIIWSGATKRWVFGWVYDQEKLRAEEWKSLALTGTHMLGTAVKTLESTTRKDE